MIVVTIVTAIALAPVAGMILAFAVLPALPIVLAIGLVLGPMNWLADRIEESEHRRDRDPGYPRALEHAHA